MRAISDYDQAIRLDPQHMEACHNRGISDSPLRIIVFYFAQSCRRSAPAGKKLIAFTFQSFRPTNRDCESRLALSRSWKNLIWIKGGDMATHSSRNICGNSRHSTGAGAPLGALLRWSAGLFLAAGLAGCASSVTSYQYSASAPPDGLYYSLPTTEIVVSATYQLSCQSSASPVATFEVTDLTLTPRVVPDRAPNARFVIDTRQLSNALSSVNPAKFEFSNGMLRNVTFKPQNELPGLITQVAQAAGRAATLFSPDDPPPPQVKCSQAFLDNQIKQIDTLKAVVRQATTVLEAADLRMQATPSEENQLAITRADQRLTAARAAVETTTARHLRRTVEFVYRPDPDDVPTVFAQDRCLLQAPTAGDAVAGVNFHAALYPLGPLFAALEPVVAGSDRGISNGDKVRLACLQLRTNALSDSAASAPAPGSAGYPGIYYRRASSGSVWLRHTLSQYQERFDNVAFMQFGPIARLRLQNGILENRGYTLAFAEDGQLVSYELTSSSIAGAYLTAASSAPQTAREAANTAMQTEIDRLTKERELIEARAALEEAREEEAANQAAPD